MTVMNRGCNALAAMTVRDLARLRTLNERLERIEQGLADLPLTGLLNRRDAHSSSVRAFVHCSARRTIGERRIARLDGSAFLSGRAKAQSAVTARPTLPPPLTDVRACRLFRDLYEAHLHGDWDTMLLIESLHVEISLTQQLD
jgi:hypothetical protein